jgi:hypothetical protein
MWTRMASTTDWRFQGIPMSLTYYRVNTSGLSADVQKQLKSWERFRDKLEGYAPDLVRRSGRRSEAYQFRYLARRAAISGQGKLALGLIFKSIVRFPFMSIEEPRRTIETIGFSVLAACLPTPAFDQLKNRVFGARSNSLAAAGVVLS